MGKQMSAQVGPYGAMVERWRPRGSKGSVDSIHTPACAPVHRHNADRHDDHVRAHADDRALVVAIPMGIVQAVRRNKLTDHALNTADLADLLPVAHHYRAAQVRLRLIPVGAPL